MNDSTLSLYPAVSKIKMAPKLIMDPNQIAES